MLENILGKDTTNTTTTNSIALSSTGIKQEVFDVTSELLWEEQVEVCGETVTIGLKYSESSGYRCTAFILMDPSLPGHNDNVVRGPISDDPEASIRSTIRRVEEKLEKESNVHDKAVQAREDLLEIIDEVVSEESE